MKTHRERIKCPECEHVQIAKVDHTIPWWTYIHQCVKCDCWIGESEWDEVPEVDPVLERLREDAK